MDIFESKGYKWKTLKEVYEGIPPLDAGELIRQRYPQYSGIWCRTQVSSVVLGLLHDHVVLSHGPLGCTSVPRNFFLSHFTYDTGLPFLNLLSTDMGNTDVILGGEEKLDNAIRAVERDYKPSLIVIITNCAPGLTGDDVQGVIEAVQPEVEAKILFMPAEGFSQNVCGVSVELQPQYLVDLMDPPKKKIKDAVNILGMTKEIFSAGSSRVCEQRYQNDGDELVRYLDAMNLKLHRFFISGDYEYIRTAPEASLNVFECITFGLPMAKLMKERFGIPHTRHTGLLGIEATKKWIMEIAEFMGRQEEAENFIKKEVAEVEGDWQRCREMVQGRVLLVDCGRNTQISTQRSLAFVRMCQELGMERAYLFNLHPLEMKGRGADTEYFLEEGINPMVLDAPYHYQDPANLPDVMRNLGLDGDQVLHFINDVYPYDRAGLADPCDTPRIDSAAHHRKDKFSCGRGLGFRAVRSWARDIMAAVKASKRRDKPTLFGRLSGRSLDFQKMIGKETSS